MNLHFFLLKILSKMSNKVHKYPKSVITSLTHPCLITSLVYHELCINRIDVNIFLVDVGFDLKEEIDKNAEERRKMKNMGHKIKSPTESRDGIRPGIKFTYIRKKIKIRFNPMTINPLFQLTEATDRIERGEIVKQHGRQRKKTKQLSWLLIHSQKIPCKLFFVF